MKKKPHFKRKHITTINIQFEFHPILKYQKPIILNTQIYKDRSIELA